MGKFEREERLGERRRTPPKERKLREEERVVFFRGRREAAQPSSGIWWTDERERSIEREKGADNSERVRGKKSKLDGRKRK